MPRLGLRRTGLTFIPLLVVLTTAARLRAVACQAGSRNSASRIGEREHS